MVHKVGDGIAAFFAGALKIDGGAKRVGIVALDRPEPVIDARALDLVVGARRRGGWSMMG